MAEPAFTDLAKLLKKPPVVTRPGPPDAAQWLENFSIWLEESYQKAVHKDRAPGLHCSTLYETCARKEGLVILHPPEEEVLKAGQLATFDMGHMMHWWWQHRYLGPKQELWGKWFCAGCGITTTGFMPLNCSCGRDWRLAMNYKELFVEDKELGYVGHTDGVLVDRISDTRRIFEFKSISPSEFKDLSKPKGAHVIQAHAYMRSLSLTEALIVYQNKGSQCEWKTNELGDLMPGRLNIKTYVVKFDPAIWKGVEDLIKSRAMALEEFNAILKDGKPLTQETVCKYKRICATKSADAARYCPVKNVCFSLPAPDDKPKASDPFEDFRIPI
jgi:hypothetical protein